MVKQIFFFLILTYHLNINLRFQTLDVVLPLQERCCFNCNGCIEDKKHAILHCPLYSDFRTVLFSSEANQDNNFVQKVTT